MTQAMRSEPMEWWVPAAGVLTTGMGIVGGFLKGRQRRDETKFEQETRREAELAEVRQEYRKDRDEEAAKREKDAQKLEKLEAQHFEAREKMVTLMEGVGQLRTENRELGGKVQALETENSSLRGRVETLETQIRAKDGELLAKDRELAAIAGARDALERENTSLHSQLADAHARNLELEVKVATGRSESEKL